MTMLHICVSYVDPHLQLLAFNLPVNFITMGIFIVN